jgi:hypothetical protein
MMAVGPLKASALAAEGDERAGVCRGFVICANQRTAGMSVMETVPVADVDLCESPADPVAYSVVVPVYNSSSVLPRLYGELVPVMESLGAPFELIFVDDASVDGAWAVLERMARVDPRVCAIQLARNVGQSSATLAGLRQVTGNIVITLDDDLQHPPREIPRLLAQLETPENYDLVLGIANTGRHSGWRRAASLAINILISAILRKRSGPRFSAFRAMRRGIADTVGAQDLPDPFLSVLLLRFAPRIGVVRVEHSASALKSSRYSLAELGRAALGCFQSLSEADRRRFVAIAGGSGTGLLALTLAGSALAPSGPATVLFGCAAGFSSTLPICLALVGAAAGRRIKTIQPTTTAQVAVERLIARRSLPMASGSRMLAPRQRFARAQ